MRNRAAAGATKKRAAAHNPPAKVSKRAKADGVKKQAKKPASTSKLNRAATEKLQLFSVGAGSAGELGLGPYTLEVTHPVLNDGLSPESVGVVDLSVAAMHVVALSYDNKMFTWGGNDDGALGRDTAWDLKMQSIDDPDANLEDAELNPRESIPTAISADKFPSGTNFVQVSAGDSATFALTEDGLVYGWGTFRVTISSILGLLLEDIIDANS